MDSTLHPETPSRTESHHLPRRDFLKMVGGAGALIAAQGAVNIWPLQAAPVGSGRNVIILITDQERALQWFPPGWAAENLPCQTALASTGVTFSHAYTNTAMCTPARTTLFTGLYPAQHLSMNTLSEGNVQSESEHQLNPTYPNLGTVMTDAGYEMAYIGKYHLSKGIIQPNGVNIWDDIERYSFSQWDPPDAGRNTSLGDYGGGNADNDGRYISDALAYLTNKINNPGGKPFCLVISLVNPHDVLGYPLPENYIQGGYGPDDDFGGITDWTAPTTPPIGLPPTIAEDLGSNFKPTCQLEYLAKCVGLGPLPTEQTQLNYLSFYGNLMKYVDSQFQQIMDLLKTSPNLLNNTWIVRTSDHGEYGLVHGGLRQKSFSVYEEAIRVPLIWSNPVDYPAGTGQQCDQLVGHVDFLPTLCSMLGINPKQYHFEGTDYSSLIRNPGGPAVQDYILFTYDDIWCGQNAAGLPDGLVDPPNRIRAVRQLDYVYAYYFDGEGVAQPQAEFYDLRTTAQGGTDTDPATGNPIQYTNLSAWAETLRKLAGQPALITPALAAKRAELQKQLQQAVQTKLQPLPVQPAVPPQNFSIGEINWTDDYGQPQSALQITWLSRSSTEYQLQLSTDHITWTSVGYPIPGNNGPIILTQPVTGLSDVFYRLAWRPNPDNERIPEPQGALA